MRDWIMAVLFALLLIRSVLATAQSDASTITAQPDASAVEPFSIFAVTPRVIEPGQPVTVHFNRPDKRLGSEASVVLIDGRIARTVGEAHYLAHQTFPDVPPLDQAIHTAVDDLNRERMVDLLAKLRISA